MENFVGRGRNVQIPASDGAAYYRTIGCDANVAVTICPVFQDECAGSFIVERVHGRSFQFDAERGIRRDVGEMFHVDKERSILVDVDFQKWQYVLRRIEFYVFFAGSGGIDDVEGSRRDKSVQTVHRNFPAIVILSCRECHGLDFPDLCHFVHTGVSGGKTLVAFSHIPDLQFGIGRIAVPGSLGGVVVSGQEFFGQVLDPIYHCVTARGESTYFVSYDQFSPDCL